MHDHILLVDCPDRKGLVHGITGLLLDQDVNITKNDEFVDPISNHFFMRTEFKGNVEEAVVVDQLQKYLGKQAKLRFNPNRKKKVVVLATKEHHCLGDLMIRNQFNDFNADILAVISNHKILQSLVGSFGVPFHFISHEQLDRSDHEETVIKALDIYQPEYIVLAKYMRILTPDFVSKFQNRIINIHHSFLPAFAGASPYRQAFKRGVKIIGATAHFVTNDLDEGPIIFQDVIRVDHRFSVNDLSDAGRDVEKTVLSRALRLVFDDRVFIHRNKTVIF
jgi:formyltetrahydrofolate deformylase